MITSLRVLAVAALLLPTALTPGPAAASVVVPPGVTAAVAVFDRQAGAFTEQHNPTLQVRSASVVKLLIALDHLWNLGPAYQVPAADRTRLDAMLRGSDDAAASTFWARNGGAAIVTRMVTRLGLANTAPPPAAYPGYWGYTALTAADTVTIYRYLLDTAPAPVRALIMDNLRAATRCATDRYEQHFGIPEAFATPWALKQGWSGFGAPPPTVCGTVTAAAPATNAPPPTTAGSAPAATGPAAAGTVTAAPAPAPAGPALAAVDLVRPVLHTTGVVGAGDRSIVVVFTLHPTGAAFLDARNALTGLVRGLSVPGATAAPPSRWVGTWGSGVRVRSGPDTAASQVGTVPTGGDVRVSCQRRGTEVVVGGVRSDWWAFLPEFGGYMTNVYVDVPENKIPGVTEC